MHAVVVRGLRVQLRINILTAYACMWLLWLGPRGCCVVRDCAVLYQILPVDTCLRLLLLCSRVRYFVRLRCLCAHVLFMQLRPCQRQCSSGPRMAGLSAAIPNLSPFHGFGRIDVDSLEAAFRYDQHALARACEALGSAEELIHLISNRTASTSSAFSGIGTDITADSVHSHCFQEFINENWTGDHACKPVAVKFESKFAMDFDNKCIEELLAHPAGSGCVFKDVLEFAPSSLRTACGLDGGAELPGETLRKVLPTCQVLLHGWCYRHGKVCALQRADRHSAGSPCTDHSSFGLGKRFAGSKAKLFYLWAAQRRRLQETVIFHENVINFGHEELDELLADLYIIVRTQLDVHDFGWPIDRRRQYCLLLHRKFMHAVLQDSVLSIIMCCVCSACIRTRPERLTTRHGATSTHTRSNTNKRREDDQEQDNNHRPTAANNNTHTRSRGALDKLETHRSTRARAHAHAHGQDRRTGTHARAHAHAHAHTRMHAHTCRMDT